MQKGAKGGNTRPEKAEASTKKVEVRLTPEEHAEWKALARYFQISVANLMRKLETEERERLVKSGKKPPRR